MREEERFLPIAFSFPLLTTVADAAADVKAPHVVGFVVVNFCVRFDVQIEVV